MSYSIITGLSYDWSTVRRIGDLVMYLSSYFACSFQLQLYLSCEVAEFLHCMLH